MAKHQEGRSPYKFFLLTFAYSWILWLPLVLDGIGIVDLGIEVSEAVLAIAAGIGAFSPLAAAITLIVRRHGWKEAWQFFRQAFDFRTRPRYYLLALLVPLMMAVVAHYLAPVFNLQVADTLVPEEAGNPWLFFVPYFFFILLIGGGQEEWGWRGYAQQPLQERFGVIKASLLIGIAWSFWHLPLWFFPGSVNATYPYLGFVLFTTSSAVVYGWIYNASGQKLIIPLLMHAMNNTVPPLFPFLHRVEGKPETAYWIYAGAAAVAGLIAATLIRRRGEVS